MKLTILIPALLLLSIAWVYGEASSSPINWVSTRYAEANLAHLGGDVWFNSITANETFFINETVSQINTSNITADYLTVNQDTLLKDEVIIGDYAGGNYVKIHKGNLEGLDLMFLEYSSVDGLLKGVAVNNRSLILHSSSIDDNPEIILANLTNILDEQGAISFNIPTNEFIINTNGQVPLVLDSDDGNISLQTNTYFKDDVYINNNVLHADVSSKQIYSNATLNLSKNIYPVQIGYNKHGATLKSGYSLNYNDNFSQIQVITPFNLVGGGYDPSLLIGYENIFGSVFNQFPILTGKTEGFAGGILNEVLLFKSGLYVLGRPQRSGLIALDAAISVFHTNFSLPIGAGYKSTRGGIIYDSPNDRMKFYTDTDEAIKPDISIEPKGNIKIPIDNKLLYFGESDDTFMYWDEANFNINTTNGTLKILNQSGWGVIEYGDAIEHTHNQTTSNPLETFINANDYEECEVYTTHINKSDCIDVYDYSKYCLNEEMKQELEMADLCFNSLEQVPQEYLSYFVEVEQYKEACSTYEVKGHSVGCTNANIRGALEDLNRNIDLYDNVTDFNTDIMAEEIYTQSKTIDSNEDYLDKFTLSQLDTKESHKNYKRNIGKTGLDGLNMEDRIVDLEGVILALKEEIARLDKEIENLKTQLAGA